MNPTFAIPARFQSKLKPAPSTDSRTDAEVIQSLRDHVPVTSEKNIWAYWDSGVANMPDWCQRNVASWVRMHDSSWTVRVLDNTPSSPNYVLKILPASQLPDCFVNGTMDSAHIAQESSDFVRGLALVTYGGVYLDIGCILFMDLDWICWNAIIDPTTPYTAMVPHIMGGTCGNAFLACRKGDPFFRRWHDLFTSVWEGRTNTRGILQHPSLDYEQDDDTRRAYDAAIAAQFTVGRERVLEYLGQWICWERLTLMEDEVGGFSPARHFQNCIMKLQASKEIWGMDEYLPGGKGIERLELLTTRLDSDPSSEQYQKAEGFVFRLLTESCLEKIGRGTGMMKETALGLLLDEDETRQKDAAEGTFAQLLRFGAENFAQTRKAPCLVGV